MKWEKRGNSQTLTLNVNYLQSITKQDTNLPLSLDNNNDLEYQPCQSSEQHAK